MSDKRKPAGVREWHVPSNLPDIVMHAQNGYADELDPIGREESMQAFMDAEAICHRLGGLINIGAVKVERTDGFITVGYSFYHKSFVETVDKARQAKPEVTDPAPDLADEADVVEPEPVLN